MKVINLASAKFNNFRKKASSLKRDLARTDQNIIKNYFLNNQIRKLHIGCGNHRLKGWLNADLSSNSAKILRIDATKTFPFDSTQFDYIFSEHMIEHITYSGGEIMLSECFRVLKPGGKLRISTPDFLFLINLYQDNKSKIQTDFIKHSSDKWIENSPLYKNAPDFREIFVINNYMRSWGHEFIYDEKVLHYLLEKIGFIKVSRVNVSESQDEALQKLENVSRKPPGLISLESLVMECIKP
ncbi:MAG: methyltransferase domain-containing protein [Cyanobacteria bacterium P01_D01_bin.50]